MGYRRWYRAVNVDRHYMDDVKSADIVCVYCRLESTAADRGSPVQGYGSVATYVKHYADQHMWVHGMLSVSDVRIQTVMWETERIRRSGPPFLTVPPARFRTYRPDVFGDLNLE